MLELILKCEESDWYLDIWENSWFYIVPFAAMPITSCFKGRPAFDARFYEAQDFFELLRVDLIIEDSNCYRLCNLAGEMIFHANLDKAEFVQLIRMQKRESRSQLPDNYPSRHDC